MQRLRLWLASLACSIALSMSVPVAAAEDAEPTPALSGLSPRARTDGAKPISLLPIRFTGFGDLYWSHDSEVRDGFHVGSLELDVALDLAPWVSVFAAMPYDADRDAMGLAAFTVDNGLFGSDAHALIPSKVIDASGVVLGRFDVPFGIGYLEYASTDNRVVVLPRAIEQTHGAWNDIGIQAYATGKYGNFVGFLVDGTGLPQPEAGAPDYALGGRVGLTPLGGLECGCSLQLGASLAQAFGTTATRLTLTGLDLAATGSFLTFKNELIQLSGAGAAVRRRGFYSEVQARLGSWFSSAREDVVATQATITQRDMTFGFGREIIKDGETRLVYRHGFETHEDAVFIQIVGGSRWQPTGLRR